MSDYDALVWRLRDDSARWADGDKVMCNAAADAIEMLVQQNEFQASMMDGAIVDALRYRWLRTHATPPTLAAIAWGHSKAACDFTNPDAAIDAAMKEKP